MIYFILLGIFGAPEIIIIAGVVLLLFGGRKIPELMRGMGSGIRNFKDGMDGRGNDDGDAEGEEEKKELEK